MEYFAAWGILPKMTNLMRFSSRSLFCRTAPVRLLFAILLLGSATAYGTVTIQVQAGELQDASGNPMPTSGLVLLVASTENDVFEAPTANRFTPQDDQVVFRGNLDSTGVPGNLAITIPALDLGNGWSSGDRLALFWFPTLQTGAASPGAGTPYGIYAPAPGEQLDGGQDWVTPGDGGTITIKFLNADANIPPVISGGSNPVALARASLATPGGSSGGNDGDSGGTSGSDNPANQEPPGSFSLDALFAGASFNGSAARFSDWFGIYFNANDASRWVFHNDLGWLYVVTNTDDSIWLYDNTAATFIWTSKDIYPSIFSNQAGGWLLFEDRNEDGTRSVFNFGTRQFEDWGNIFQ